MARDDLPVERCQSELALAGSAGRAEVGAGAVAGAESGVDAGRGDEPFTPASEGAPAKAVSL